MVCQALSEFRPGNLEVLDLMHEDIVFHNEGVHRLSGTYRGRTTVFEFFQSVQDNSGGSYRIEIRNAMALGKTMVAVVARSTARRADQELDATAVHIARLADDRIVEYWVMQTDPDDSALFWD